MKQAPTQLTKLKRIVLTFGAILALGASIARAESLELLNVSYDPTRELYRAINNAFIAKYKAETGTELTIRQSHGGSGTQARAVVDGLEADVVTLAMWPDTNAVAKAGLLPLDWTSKLPNDSAPYASTLVFEHLQALACVAAAGGLVAFAATGTAGTHDWIEPGLAAACTYYAGVR